ncbi:MAG: NUDIX hydrolase [Actinobacteria bacterium]|nr:NUDIX hydrolase [Actinomycetota bacterium]
MPDWLGWARRLGAVAQSGLAYAESGFDAQRYEAVREVASELMAAASGDAPTELRGLLAAEVGHATPKVDVRGVVFVGERVLLVREREDGRWTLPGGWADPGETPAEAVVREVAEEAGYHTRAVRLLAVYDRDRQGHTPPLVFSVYKLFFECEVVEITASDGVETDGVDLFEPSRLPPLSLGRVTGRQIARFAATRGTGDRGADFD